MIDHCDTSGIETDLQADLGRRLTAQRAPDTVVGPASSLVLPIENQMPACTEPTYCLGMSLPAKRAGRAVAHSTAAVGVVAVIAAVFGVAAWVANLIVVGVVAVVVTIVGAYVLSRR